MGLLRIEDAVVVVVDAVVVIDLVVVGAVVVVVVVNLAVDVGAIVVARDVVNKVVDSTLFSVVRKVLSLVDILASSNILGMNSGRKVSKQLNPQNFDLNLLHLYLWSLLHVLPLSHYLTLPLHPDHNS